MAAYRTNLEVDGFPIYVEVVPTEILEVAPDAELAGRGGDQPPAFNVEAVGRAAAAAIHAIHADMIDRLGEAMPDTLGVEFGLTVSGEGGFIFKAGASSEFSISAEWDLAARRKRRGA